MVQTQDMKTGPMIQKDVWNVIDRGNQRKGDPGVQQIEPGKDVKPVKPYSQKMSAGFGQKPSHSSAASLPAKTQITQQKVLDNKPGVKAQSFGQVGHRGGMVMTMDPPHAAHGFGEFIPEPKPQNLFPQGRANGGFGSTKQQRSTNDFGAPHPSARKGDDVFDSQPLRGSQVHHRAAASQRYQGSAFDNASGEAQQGFPQATIRELSRSATPQVPAQFDGGHLTSREGFAHVKAEARFKDEDPGAVEDFKDFGVDTVDSPAVPQGGNKRPLGSCDGIVKPKDRFPMAVGNANLLNLVSKLDFKAIQRKVAERAASLNSEDTWHGTEELFQQNMDSFNEVTSRFTVLHDRFQIMVQRKDDSLDAKRHLTHQYDFAGSTLASGCIQLHDATSDIHTGNKRRRIEWSGPGTNIKTGGGA